MNKRPRAHRPTASEGSAGSSGGSGSAGRNGGGSAGTQADASSQPSTTMSARAFGEEAAGMGRGGGGEVDSALDYYESGSEEESRSSSSKRRRSSYAQSRSRAGDTASSLANVDVVEPPPIIEARASTTTLTQHGADDVAVRPPTDTTPPVTAKETCDLTDWEALKVLFVRAVEAFDDESALDSQSASTLLHAVLTECNRFLTFYRDPSVLFLPSTRKKTTKGSSPSALTPPDVRLRRDWGVGSGSSSGSGSSWRSHPSYHTDEEIPAPSSSTPVLETPASPPAKYKRKRGRSKKKNNDIPTAFHTLYGTALLLYGILVYRSGSAREDENQETPQEGTNYPPPYGSPMQGVSPTISSSPLPSVSSTPSQAPLMLAYSPRHSPLDSSMHSRLGMGVGQTVQISPLLPLQTMIHSPTYSSGTSPSGGATTPSASSTSGATGTGSTSASNVRPISSRTSSSASTSTQPSSYFSIPIVHQSPTWTTVMPLIPSTRSAFTSPADLRSMAQKKMRYPPTYYWLAALDVFAKGETIVSERAGIELTSGRSSSSLDASVTVHDPFFSPKKHHSARHGRHHLHSHSASARQPEFTSYDFPSDKNPFRTSFSFSDASFKGHDHAGNISYDAIREESSSGVEDPGTSTEGKDERRKRKRKSEGDSKYEKEKEDWRLPLGWGRTLVCIADEKASAELRERERSLLQSQSERPSVDIKAASASAVPRSYFCSYSLSEYHGREGAHPSSSSPEPVTVTTPNGSTKNMASSQTPASRNAQLLRESAHHLLVLAVDQFTRGMLYMPRRSRSRKRESSKLSSHHDDPDVDSSLSKVTSDEATSPTSPAVPPISQSSQSSTSSSLSSSSKHIPPSLSDLLPFSRTRTLISIADAVLDVAAKLCIPDDRAYWGRWVNGILDVDERMNVSSSSSQVGHGLGFSSVVFSTRPESMSAFSGNMVVQTPGSGGDDDVFANPSASGGDNKTHPAQDEKENDNSTEENVDVSLLQAARGLTKARAWVLMGTAINEGTPERVRASEEREARDALRKATGLLEDCLTEIERFKTLVDEDAAMSTSSSGETVTQENVDSRSSAESQPEVKAAPTASLEQRKLKALSLETSSRKLLYDIYSILIDLVEETERDTLLSRARNLEALLVTAASPLEPGHGNQTQSSSIQEVSMDCDHDPPSTSSNIHI